MILASLLLHRPSDRVAVVFEGYLACRFQADGSFAGKVVVKVLVNRCEVAGLVLSVVKMGGDALLEIAFDEIGTKKLMAKTASAHMKKL